MKKIYLLSGPDKRKGFIEELALYLKKDLSNAKKIVAISANPEKYEKNDKYIYGSDDSLGLIKMFEKAGITTLEYTLLDARVNSEKGIEAIKEADVIHLMGGDPIDQLEFIKEYDYENYIKEANSIIIGTSAGAMNLAEDVYCPKYEKINEAFFYKGLGLTNITIEPHFDVTNEDQVKEAKRMSISNKIIGLPDASAIIIEKDNNIFIGDYYIYD